MKTLLFLETVKCDMPLSINSLWLGAVLLDRRSVYRKLKENSIPVPKHITVSRDVLGQDPPGFFEDVDFVELDGGH